MAALAGSGLLLLLAALCWWRADHPVAEWCRPLDADWASVVSILGQAEVWLIPGAIGFAWYALRRNCNQARWCFLLGISIGISGGLVNVLKLLVARPRPHWDTASDGISFSFPSGHAATVASAAMALCLWQPRGWPVWVAVALAVAAARVATHDHFPSDVICGLLLGGLVTLGCQWVWARRWPASLPKLAPPVLAMIAAGVVLQGCASPGPAMQQSWSEIDTARGKVAVAREQLVRDVRSALQGMGMRTDDSKPAAWDAAVASLRARSAASVTPLERSVATSAAPRLGQDLAALRSAATGLQDGMVHLKDAMLRGESPPPGSPPTLDRLMDLKREVEELKPLMDSAEALRKELARMAGDAEKQSGS